MHIFNHNIYILTKINACIMESSPWPGAQSTETHKHLLNHLCQIRETAGHLVGRRTFQGKEAEVL